ncbi:MAG TPA: iron-containing redox enzyme family protein [Acidimicrobiales bacterium]|nr:iron-containing redox enzyme family protein [Acidimicrobiales bacterium]
MTLDHYVPAPLAPIPSPRGPVSAYLLDHLQRPPHPLPAAPIAEDDPLVGEDSQLALYCCYELHYRPMAGVADAWEWEPSLLAFRQGLERAFEERVRDEVGPIRHPDDIGSELHRLIAEGGGPSLSAHARDRAGLAQLRELAVHRSAYQLKEADPHSWALPRLWGPAKSAMVEIQCDEYGHGVEGQAHAELWAMVMEALGLESTYGAYLDLIPGVTLATTNLISLFGLHRRWRGALVGHLAAFEMTSVTPMTRYAEGLARVGVGPEGRRFYDVHVQADAVHEKVAVSRLARGLAGSEPALAPDIAFGATALMAVERRFASHVLDRWAAGGTSLLASLPAVASCPAG